jgi:hypothetical protein
LSADSGPPKSVRKFLLDQGFPKPMAAIDQLDRNLRYSHLSDAFPEFSAVSTPDWLVILLAAEGGFDGLVARDKRQLLTPESVVALALNPSLSFVTWRHSIEDPITEWGQLMAYMPLVLKWIDAHGAGIFWLPRPSLEAKSVMKARNRAGELASEWGQAYPDLLAEAGSTMRAELHARKLLRRLGRLAGSE